MRRLSETWWLTIAALILVAVVAIPFATDSWSVSRRKLSRAHLQQIGRALHAYHDRHDSFPPAYTVDDSGRRLHSWRTLLLPYLGEQQLYDEIHLDEPWDSPHNRPLAVRRPDCYRSPLASNPGMTCFLAVVGKQTAWPEQYPSSVDDITDGVANTIQLIESPDVAVTWTEPRDLSYDDAQSHLELLRKRDTGAKLGRHVLLADGTVKRLYSRIDPQIFRWLLTARMGRPLRRVDWPDASPPYQFGPPADAGSLSGTSVLPFVSALLAADKNVVWCATFQIAWDQLPKEPDLPRGDGSFVGELERKPFDLRSLSPDSYLAMGGDVEDGIRDRIGTEMARRFPDVVPSFSEASPRDEVVIYAFLRKLLPFAQKFVELSVPLPFIAGETTTPVSGFGYERAEPNADRDRELREQVTVLDYVSPDDFILRLSTKTERDEIFLAKVAPRETLSAVWQDVQVRIQQPRGENLQREFQPAETLRVPKLLLNVERNYDELHRSFIGGRPIHVARQIVRFRLDESGAILESEAEIVAEFGEDTPRAAPRPRHFAFDRQFLLALQERGATQPYLLIWIANTELMERASVK
jgi:hypothetical protein